MIELKGYIKALEKSQSKNNDKKLRYFFIFIFPEKLKAYSIEMKYI